MRNQSGPRLAIESVLILDDDEAMLQALVDVVDESGHLPRIARTLSEARTILATERPTLLLLDLTLNAEYGGDLLEELTRDPDAPGVVIVSAFGLATMVGQRYEIPVVKKPFALEELLTVLRDSIEEAPRPRKAG